MVAPDNRAGRKKAEAALAQLILDHEHQPIAPKAELGTVADLFDRWLASQAHRLSPKTLAEYRRAARLKILPHIGDLPLFDVAVSHRGPSESSHSFVFQQLHLERSLQESGHTTGLNSFHGRYLPDSPDWHSSQLLGHYPSS